MLGHVVARGPQPARRDDETGAVERVGDGGADVGGAVGDGHVTHDLGAGGGEGAAQVRGVRIGRQAQHQLRADGDDLELHDPVLKSAR